MNWKLILICLISCLLFHCTAEKQEKSVEKATPVYLKSVERKALTIPVQSSGMLSSKSMVKLAFKIGGVIKSIEVDEGQSVSRNQVLARLDQTEIGSMKKQAETAYFYSKREYDRVRKLEKDSIATLAELQAMEAKFDIARSDLEIAQFNQAHSVIRAPSSGRILKKLAEPNEVTGAGMPILIFSAAGTNSWVVRTGLSDKDIINVKSGDKAEVTFDAYPHETFTASVSEIAEVLDPTSATFEVELTLDPVEVKLISGFSADVKIFPKASQQLDFIPVDALAEADGYIGYVYTVTPDNEAKKLQVKIANIHNGEVAILEGLEGVKKVVSGGSLYLEPGKPVRILDKPVGKATTTEGLSN